MKNVYFLKTSIAFHFRIHVDHRNGDLISAIPPRDRLFCRLSANDEQSIWNGESSDRLPFIGRFLSDFKVTACKFLADRQLLRFSRSSCRRWRRRVFKRLSTTKKCVLFRRNVTCSWVSKCNHLKVKKSEKNGLCTYKFTIFFSANGLKIYLIFLTRLM